MVEIGFTTARARGSLQRSPRLVHNSIGISEMEGAVSSRLSIALLAGLFGLNAATAQTASSNQGIHQEWGQFLSDGDRNWQRLFAFCPISALPDTCRNTLSRGVAHSYLAAVNKGVVPDNKVNEVRLRIDYACKIFDPDGALPFMDGTHCHTRHVNEAGVEPDEHEGLKREIAKQQALKGNQENWRPRQTQGDQGPSWWKCQATPAPFGFADHPGIAGMAGCAPWQ